MSMFGFVILSVVAQIPTFEKIKAFKKDPLNMIMESIWRSMLVFWIIFRTISIDLSHQCVFSIHFGLRPT